MRPVGRPRRGSRPFSAGRGHCPRPLLRSARSGSYAAFTSRRGEAVALPSSFTRPPFKAPRAVGDIAPDVALRALDGATLDLRGDTMAGNPIAILFCPKFTDAVAEPIGGFRAGEAGFPGAGAGVLALPLGAAKISAQHALSLPVLPGPHRRAVPAFH